LTTSQVPAIRPIPPPKPEVILRAVSSSIPVAQEENTAREQLTPSARCPDPGRFGRAKTGIIEVNCRKAMADEHSKLNCDKTA
jgi:hypothetical protein